MTQFGTIPPGKCRLLHKTAGLLPIYREGKAPRGTESFKPSPAHNHFTPNRLPDRTQPGSQVLSRPSGNLVLVCSLRKEKRKGKAGQQGASWCGAGPPCTLRAQASKPSVFILWSEKRISWWVFNIGRVWWWGTAHTPHSPCTGTWLYTISQTGSSLIKVASSLAGARNLPLPCSTHR